MTWLRAFSLQRGVFRLTLLLGIAAHPTPRWCCCCTRDAVGCFSAQCVLWLARTIIGLPDGEIRGLDRLPLPAYLTAMKHHSSLDPWSAGAAG